MTRPRERAVGGLRKAEGDVSMNWACGGESVRASGWLGRSGFGKYGSRGGWWKI